MDNLAKIKSIIQDLSLVNVDDLTEESRLIEDVGFDSLDSVEFLSYLEEDFEKEINEEEFLNCKTLGDIVKLISS